MEAQSSKVPNQWHSEMTESSKSHVSNHSRMESQVNTYVEITNASDINFCNSYAVKNTMVQAHSMTLS